MIEPPKAVIFIGIIFRTDKALLRIRLKIMYFAFPYQLIVFITEGDQPCIDFKVSGQIIPVISRT